MQQPRAENWKKKFFWVGKMLNRGEAGKILAWPRRGTFTRRWEAAHTHSREREREREISPLPVVHTHWASPSLSVKEKSSFLYCCRGRLSLTRSPQVALLGRLV